MSHDPWVPDLDLGEGHSLIWTTWDPDLDLNPQYRDVPPLQPHEYYGAIIRHPAGPSVQPHTVVFYGPGICEGGITFDTPTTAALATRDSWHGDRWQVVSWDPLHIEPSILCDCGDHGYIRDGRWVGA